MLLTNVCVRFKHQILELAIPQLKRRQSIYGKEQSGRKLRELKIKQENTKDVAVSLTKYIKKCLHYSFNVLFWRSRLGKS